MAKDQTADKQPMKNLHLCVPEDFHQRVKMLCVMKRVPICRYAIEALEEKVARDDEAIKTIKRSA